MELLQGVQAARTMVSDYMASLQTRSITASQGRPGPGGDVYGADQTQLCTSSGDGARAVSTYLDGLRSRSMAARATRSGPGSHPMHGTPAAMAAAQAAAGVPSRPGQPHGPSANDESKPASPAVPPAPTGNRPSPLPCTLPLTTAHTPLPDFRTRLGGLPRHGIVLSLP